jgi:membrane-associated PAP2 superfamily phosphatase
MSGRDAVDFERARRFALEFAGVAAILVIASAVIRALDIDLDLARRAYLPGDPPSFWGRGRAFWDAVYDIGVWPANVVGFGSLVALLGSRSRGALRRHRRGLLLLVLVLALGPGVAVNLALKEHWGRPRPRDVEELGGDQTFLPVGDRGIPGGGESFPSGHAAMGFFFLTFYLLLRDRRPGAARWALAGSIVAGCLLGFQRIAVGAHWPSDVLWAGGVVYLTALAVDALLPASIPPPGPRRTALAGLASAIAIATLLLAFVANPFQRTVRWNVAALPPGRIVAVRTDLEGATRGGDVHRIRAAGEVLWVESRLSGYGSFDADMLASLETLERGDTLVCLVHLRRTGLVNRIRPAVRSGVAPPGAAG